MSDNVSRRPRRGLVPRTEETYSNLAHGRQMSGGSKLPSTHLVLNSALGQLQLFTGRAEGGSTIFRPFPAINPREPDTGFLPGRRSAAAGDYTSWCVMVPVVSYAGLKSMNCDQLTWALCHPADLAEAWRTNPYMVMYSKARRVARGAQTFADNSGWDARWNKLLPELGGKKGQSSEMPTPTSFWYYQAAVFAGFVYDRDVQESVYTDFMVNSNTPYGLNRDDPLCIVQASGRAGSDLLTLLDTEKKVFSGESTDPSAGYRYGDPVGHFTGTEIRGGLVLELFRPHNASTIEPNSTYDGQYGGRSQSYAFRIRKSYESAQRRIFPADLTSDMVDQIIAKRQYWFPSKPGAKDGVIYIPGIEEQAELTIRCYSAVSKMVRLCWLEHPQFMTESVKAVINAKRTFAGPGNYQEPVDDRPSRAVQSADFQEDDAVNQPRRSQHGQTADDWHDRDRGADRRGQPVQHNRRDEFAEDHDRLSRARQQEFDFDAGSDQPADDFDDTAAPPAAPRASVRQPQHRQPDEFDDAAEPPSSRTSGRQPQRRPADDFDDESPPPIVPHMMGRQPQRRQPDEFDDEASPTQQGDDYNEDAGFDDEPPSVNQRGQRTRTSPHLEAGKQRPPRDEFDEESSFTDDTPGQRVRREAQDVAHDVDDRPATPAKAGGRRDTPTVADEELFDFDSSKGKPANRPGRRDEDSVSSEQADEEARARSLKAARERAGKRDTSRTEEAAPPPPPEPPAAPRRGRPRKDK